MPAKEGAERQARPDLASFAGLDANFAHLVTEALHTDGWPGGEVADVFAARIAERAKAETEARASDVA